MGVKEYKHTPESLAKIRAAAKKVPIEYGTCHTCGKSFAMSKDQRGRFHRNPERKCYCSRACQSIAFGAASVGNKHSLGHKMTAESLAKMSLAQTGHRGYALGYKHTPEAKQRMGAAKIGNKYTLGHKFSPEHRAKLGASKRGKKYWLGRKHTDADKQKMSAALKGEKSPNWKGGITSLNEVIRHSFEYRDWRTSVFTRDNFTCGLCGKRGKYLQAHHIRTFSNNPELRFDPNNGVTLCLECHGKTKTKESEYEELFLEKVVAACL